MSEIGPRIERARQLGAVSAAELGVLAGMSRGVVSMIESGERPNPGAATVVAIAVVLGVSTDWLLSGKGDPPTEEQVKAAVAAARVEFEARQGGDAESTGFHPTTPATKPTGTDGGR